MSIREKAFLVPHDASMKVLFTGCLSVSVVPLSDAEAMEQRAESAEEALRSLASWLGVGGYNAATVDAAVFERKIRDGVDMMLKAELARRDDARRKADEHTQNWAEAIASVTPKCPKETL